MSTARQRAGLRGLTKVRRTLRRLPAETTIGIRNAIEYGAAAIEADMIINIPKDTGDTAARISSKVARDGLTARIGFLGKKAVKGAYVARFIEYGTKGHGNVPAQSARPFMAPAFDANRDRILEQTQKEIKRVLDELTAEDGTDRE